MEIFSYQGTSKDQKVEGIIEANNKGEAFQSLKGQGIIVLNIFPFQKKTVAKNKSKKTSSFFKQKIKPVDIVAFTKQFATMVKAGLPILGTLEMLRNQTVNLSMKELIEDIRKRLEGGVTLSTCFAQYPLVFDNVYVNLIKAGEASGKLDIFLIKLVVSLEKKEKIKKKIKSALMYPGIMFSVATLVTIFMLTNVVPVFAKMYAGMGVALPKSTATILSMSDFLRGSGGLTLLLSLISIFFIFRYLTTKNKNIQFRWHRTILKLPVFGNLILISTAVFSSFKNLSTTNLFSISNIEQVTYRSLPRGFNNSHDALNSSNCFSWKYSKSLCLLSHFISICLLTIPDAEQGASSKILSNEFLSHHALPALISEFITLKVCPSLVKFSLILSTLFLSASTAVSFISAISIMWQALPPGAAQASKTL